MKKKVLMLLMVVLSIFSLVGCGKDKGGKDDATMLSTPTNLKVEKDLLTWDKVKGASSYDVKINDQVINVPTNEYTIPDVLDYIDVVTVIAKSDNPKVLPSERSIPIAVRKQLTDDEIKAKIETYDPDSEEGPLKDLEIEKALLLYKYNFVLSDSETTEEVIQKHADNNSIGKFLAYYMILSNTMMKQYYEELEYIESDPAVVKEYQDLYNDMKTKKVYESNIQNVMEDKRFINFIAPMILGTLITYGDCSDYALLINLLGMSNIHVDIKKIDNGFQITDEYYGDVYTITSEEIDKIRKYDKFNEFNETIVSMCKLYINNAKCAHIEDVKRHILENEGLLLYNLQENMAEIEETLKAMFNNYKKFQTTYNDLDKAIMEAENAATKEEKVVALEKVKKIIAGSLNYTDDLPKAEEVQVVLDLFLSSELLNAILSEGSMQLIFINQDKLDIIKDAILDFYKVVYDFSILTSDELTKNLDVIFNYLNNPEDENKFNLLFDALKQYSDKILQKKYYDKYNYRTLLNSIFAVSDTQGADFASIIGLATGLDFTDKEDRDIKTIMTDFDNYMSKFDYSKVEKIFRNKQTFAVPTLRELTNEEIFDIIELIDYVVAFNKEIDLTKYEKTITNLIMFLTGSGNLTTPEGFEVQKGYEFLAKNNNSLLEIIALVYELQFFDTTGYELTDEQKVANLQAQVDLVKNKIDAAKAKEYDEVAIEFQNLFIVNGEPVEETFFSGDFIKKITKLESLVGLPEERVTEEDKKLISDSPFTWFYPNPIVINYDSVNKEFAVNIWDNELRKLVRELATSTQVHISVNGQVIDLDVMKGLNAGDIIRIRAIDIKKGLINLGYNTYEELIQNNPDVEAYFQSIYINYKVNDVYYDRSTNNFYITDLLEDIYNAR